MKKAVFLGRFQPFHQGHHHAVEQLKDDYDNVRILIGSCETSRELDNPLTFEERTKLIKDCFPDIEVIGIKDEEKNKEGNKKWAAKLEEEIEDDETLVSGNSLVKKLAEQHTQIDIEKPEMLNPEIYSGSEIRRRIRSDEEWRYLVKSCAEKRIDDYLTIIRKTGIQYKYEPGWKKENSFYGTERDKL